MRNIYHRQNPHYIYIVYIYSMYIYIINIYIYYTHIS
jgi:hypothetical protein